MLRNFVLFLFVCLLMSFSVSALGITPGRTTFDFTPGLEKSVTVKVVNSEHKDLDLVVQVRGSLNESIHVGETKIHMAAKEYEYALPIDISLPDYLVPGLHTAEIVVIQVPEQVAGGSATVGTTLAVATEFHVHVPYPGQYIEGELKVSGDEKEKRFYVRTVNRGKEDIDSVYATVSIFDKEGKRVHTVETNKISLAAGERQELVANWIVDVPMGRYSAKAVVHFDGKDILFESPFEIGSFVLDLLNLYVTDFTLGSVAKFNLLVQNKWSEPINHAYAQMRVLDQDYNELADMKSATYDIPSGEKTTMVYYWDTQGIREGLYNANVLLYYGEKKTQQDLQLDVGKDAITVLGLGRVISSEEEGKSGTMIFFVIIGFLILLNVVWFIVLRKRKKF